MRRLAERANWFFALPIQPRGRTRFGDLILITGFAALSTLIIIKSTVNWALGWDALIYTKAALAIVEGHDAWGPVGVPGLYAGPPPGLLPFFPFIGLPDPVVAAGGAAIAAACGIYVLRKLQLPAWWLVYPPVLVAILAGSSALPVTALLVRGGAIAEGLGGALRVYATLPLVILGRWRALAVCAVIVAASAPFLDWPRFMSHFPTLNAVLDGQTGGGKSAAAVPMLIPVALLCLILLGRTRAAWLIVPALWPYTQNYYAVLAMPVVASAPLVALSLAVDNVPGLVVVGLAAQILVDWLLGRSIGSAIRSWLRPPEQGDEEQSTQRWEPPVDDPAQIPEGRLLATPHQEVRET